MRDADSLAAADSPADSRELAAAVDWIMFHRNTAGFVETVMFSVEN